MDIRQKLVMAPSTDMFRQTLLNAAKDLAIEQTDLRAQRKLSLHLSDAKQQMVSFKAHSYFSCYILKITYDIKGAAAAVPLMPYVICKMQIRTLQK